MKARKRSIPANELALAYELRQSGISWKCIGIGLGLHPGHLRNSLCYATQHGITHVRQ